MLGSCEAFSSFLTYIGKPIYDWKASRIGFLTVVTLFNFYKLFKCYKPITESASNIGTVLEVTVYIYIYIYI